jgi:hypothetical protein
MTQVCQQSAPAQTGSCEDGSGFILAKVSKLNRYYFFTGAFSKVEARSGTVLVGASGLFPDDAFVYDSLATAHQIANQLNGAGIGSPWHAVPEATPYEIPFAPIAHPDVKEIAPPA